MLIPRLVFCFLRAILQPRITRNSPMGEVMRAANAEIDIVAGGRESGRPPREFFGSRQLFAAAGI